MDVMIVGGGIGGLATALCLHDAGIECTVFEQSERVGELGVGINVLPHAVKLLASLGLLDRLDEVAVRTHELIYTNRFGQVIWREPRGLEAGYDVPQFSIHRGRLQRVLYDAVRERIGDDAVQTGRRLESFEQDGGGVTAHVVDRSRNDVDERRVAVLVGADGIHSRVRSLLFGTEGPPSWNGIMMWRGAVEWPRFLSGSSMIIAGGMRAKLVIYPIAAGAEAGTRLTNWVMTVKVADGTDPMPRREDWSRRGDASELAPYLRMFEIPHADIAGLVEATDAIFEYPMCDRDPLPWWSQQRVTLLGDAAHPMYPVGSNGAGQAIVDAASLTRQLTLHDSPQAALRGYESERLPATAAIVRSNRTGGPERVIDEVERRAPKGFDRLGDVIDPTTFRDIVNGYVRTAGFTVEQVNRR